MEFEIVKKAQFTVMGVSRKFNSKTSYQDIPKFWQEHTDGKIGEEICGTYGICFDDSEGDEFTYYIADDYAPWLDTPSSVEVMIIPEHTWAVFPCNGPLPEALQSVNTKIWKEWLPANKQYRLADNFNIEWYTPPCENPEEDYSEIWIPIEEK